MRQLHTYLPLIAALALEFTSAGQQPAIGPLSPDARPISLLEATTAVVNYRTATPQPTRIQLRAGVYPASTPGQEQAWEGAQVVEGAEGA
jgi:hypothetical protein